MKNLIFVFVFGIQATVFSQNKINPDVLIGYWQPNEESSKSIFQKIKRQKDQFVEPSGENKAIFRLCSDDSNVLKISFSKR